MIVFKIAELPLSRPCCGDKDILKGLESRCMKKISSQVSARRLRSWPGRNMSRWKFAAPIAGISFSMGSAR
jgi:hypothetical protein